MLFAIEPFVFGVVVGRRHRVFVGGLVCELVVKSAKAFVYGFGDHRIGVGADHDVGIGGIGPLRHPSAFPVILQERCHHVADALRRNQRDQTVLDAKCVPK